MAFLFSCVNRVGLLDPRLTNGSHAGHPHGALAEDTPRDLVLCSILTLLSFFCVTEGKTTAKNCDTCMTYIISTVGEDGVNAMGLAKVLEFVTRDDATAEEKMRAVAEACVPKIKKAMEEKGVSKNKLNKFLKYPNGGLYKCPWDITKYPKASEAATKVIAEITAPLGGLVMGK